MLITETVRVKMLSQTSLEFQIIKLAVKIRVTNAFLISRTSMSATRSETDQYIYGTAPCHITVPAPEAKH